MAFLMERLRPVAARQRALASGVELAALRGGLIGGAVAAGLGLALVALPILLLWIVTPYVVAGPGGVVHLAACVWLLAHGADLVRPATYGSPGYGGPGVPLAVTPLLVSVLALLPLYRAGVRAGSPQPPSDQDQDQDADEDDGQDEAEPDSEPHAWSALLGLGAGYLLVAAVAVAAATAGPIGLAAPLAAFGRVALVALPVAALGVRMGTGPGGYPVPSVPRIPGVPRGALGEWWGRLSSRLPKVSIAVPALPDRTRAPGGAAVALRAALGGGAALLGVGGLVLLAALLTHFGAAGTMAAQTAPDLAGRLALLLLCAVVLPNAAVWGAAYATGPGFALGGWLGPLGTGAGTAAVVNVPAFPLLTALPGPGRTVLGLLTLALAPAAGAVAAVIVGRAAESGGRSWGPIATAEVALAAALGTGLLAALCAAASGGALGTAALAQVGPSPWRTGLAVLAWTAATGVPGAVLLRWRISCRRRASAATAEAPGSRWWRTGCRRIW
ncbi:cell division protein PerM [Streptacidiphilus sp. PAMC 29251]